MTQKPPPTPEELILEMLRDVLARQARQMGLTARAAPTEKAISETPVAPPEPSKSSPPAAVPGEAKLPPKPEAPRPAEPVFRSLPEDKPKAPVPPATRRPPALAPAPPDLAYAAEAEDRLTPAELQALEELREIAARPFAPSGLAQTLRGMVLGLAALIIVVNLPLFGGLAMVRATPEQQPLVLYEGLLIQGSNASVYVIEHGAKRLISSEEAFLHRGYRWSQIRVIDDETLRDIPAGPPIHVILTCPGSADRYLLEGDRKRFITDWGAAQALGYTEADIRTVSCSRLRSFLDGPKVP